MRGIVKNKTKAQQFGFTLIETALSLMVLGVLSVVAIQAYNLYYKHKMETKTVTSAEVAENKLSDFLALNGRYPCPARADLPRDDAAYGMETDCASPVVAGATLNPGDCDNGICIEETTTARSTELGETLRVRRGMLPFRSLGLPENLAQDGYGMRLNYAVTEELAVLETYNRLRGGISVVGSDGESLLDPEGTAHFVVFSSGPDRAGAYGRFGQQSIECNVDTVDGENCNTSAANAEAVYTSAGTSKASGDGYYDDILKYSSSAETPLWKLATGETDFRNIGDDQIVMGAGAPAADFADDLDVDVKGDIKTTDKMQTGNIRSDLGTGQFRPEQLETGDYLQCPPGEYVIGFADGAVRCGIAQQGCADNQVIKGFGADGAVICETLTGCPAQEVNMCPLPDGSYEVKTLAAAFPNDNQYYYVQTSQENKYMHKAYSCRESAGPGWVFSEDNSNCASEASCCEACVEEVETVEGVDCDDESVPLTGFWDGTVDVNYTTTCPSGDVVTSPADGGAWTDYCTCEDGVRYTTSSCPSGQSGSIKKQRNFTCSSSTSGSYGPWFEIENTCACNPQTYTKNNACPVWTTGSSWQQTRERICPSGDYTAWTPSSMPAGACGSCVPVTQQYTADCPEGQSGSKNMQRVYNCSTNSWNPPTELSNNCAVSIPKWRNGTSQGQFPTPLTYERGDNCTTVGMTAPCSSPSSGGGQHTHYSGCECQ